MTGVPIARLACCNCRGRLLGDTESLRCAQCGQLYGFDQYGYANLLPPGLDVGSAIDTTESDYAQQQHTAGVRVMSEYLKPLFEREPFHDVLDVGCGVGVGVQLLASAGYEAYGVDLPALSRFWAEVGNDRERFFCGNAVRLPFTNDCFDIVYSLGVIEHVGTVVGHYTLRPDFKAQRQLYASEILRVTRPGGRIVIACPNKSFPVDIQHGPTDAASSKHPLRSRLFAWTGLNLHKTWGCYHLLSYREVRELFCVDGGAREFEALPLTGYFGFGRFRAGFLSPFRALARAYLRLPKCLRSSFVNPYVLVHIRK